MRMSKHAKRILVLLLDLIVAVISIIMATFWLGVLEDVALELYRDMPHAMPAMVLCLGTVQAIPCLIGIVLCAQSDYAGSADED